jgi:alpha-beta hydrolase superfamily lysophospholipase
MSVEPVETRLAVADLEGFGFAPAIAASLFLPACRPRALAFCLHGGGYSRKYFDIRVAGRSDYSMGAHLALRGVAVLAIDSLGSGESAKAEDPDAIVWQTLARVHHAASRDMIGMVASVGRATGRFELPPDSALPIVGIGHSLGGMLLATQQATYRSFGRLAVLGWSNLGLNLPPSALIPIPDATGKYFHSSPELRRAFHLDDVPPAVLAAEAERESLPVAAALAAQAADRAAIREAVSAIDVPLFLGYGEYDTSIDPHREPTAYPNSSDVTLYRLKGSAHCHNFAGTRTLLWDRIVDWIG